MKLKFRDFNGIRTYVRKDELSWVRNWLAPNIWTYIAQLVEHHSPNTEAVGSNLAENPKFFRVNLQLLQLR